MEPLPYTPTKFREIVEADLRRAARQIIKIQDELDPQLRIATPEGDYWIGLTLPADAAGQREAFDKLAIFMAWKQANAFTFASELVEPDCVYCSGISGKERFACLALIAREPRPWRAQNFAQIEWLSEESIDPALIDLLPKGPRSLTPKEVSGCASWFGRQGRFPAVLIKTGEVRGL